MPDAPPPFQSRPRANSFYRSLLHAWDGLLHAVLHQRNMRMHVLAAVMVGLVGSGVPLGLAEKVTLIFCVMLIFFAEMLNTALEQMVDLATQEFDEKARLVKDLAAAGVLVLAIGTVVIFAAILVHDAPTIFANPAAIERQALWGMPFVLCIGALMHEQPRPGWINLAVAAAGAVLWVNLARWTESEVFLAMNGGLWLVAVSAAWRRGRPGA